MIQLIETACPCSGSLGYEFAVWHQGVILFACATPLGKAHVCKANAKQSKAEAKQSNAKCKVQRKNHTLPLTERTALKEKYDNILHFLHILTINFFYNIFRVTRPN